MLSNYYHKSDLMEISIERYEKALREADVGYSKSLLEDPESEFVLYDADVFRQGVCQLFAYALNEKFGYPVYKIQSINTFHVFCKSYDKQKYIDVRGITEDFTVFITGTDLYKIRNDISEAYQFIDEDKCIKCYQCEHICPLKKSKSDIDK